MALEDFLRPGETVQFRSPAEVEYQGDTYDFYITNARLIWHKRKGLIFKRDAFVAAVKQNVTEIQYREKGLISKRAFIRILMKDRMIEFAGSPSTVRAVYSEMQPYMAEPEP